MVPFLIGPMTIPFVLWWQVYFTFEALMKVWPLAVPVGSVLGWLMYKRSARLVALGLHPYFSHRGHIPRKNILVLYLAMIFVTWGWALVFLALVVLPATPIEERSFKISEVNECTRKCFGCPTQVEFSNWVGANGVRFCADVLDPRPRVGEQLLVRGRFAHLVQYVRKMERVRG